MQLSSFHGVNTPVTRAKDVTEKIIAWFYAYKTINQAYADVCCQVLRDIDWVWVQDMHLMLAPDMIRICKPHTVMGFYLHTPFATSVRVV